jgi:hypothetical protein
MYCPCLLVPYECEPGQWYTPLRVLTQTESPCVCATNGASVAANETATAATANDGRIRLAILRDDFQLMGPPRLPRSNTTPAAGSP